MMAKNTRGLEPKKKRRPNPAKLKCPMCGYYGHFPCTLTEIGRYWSCWKCGHIAKTRKEGEKWKS